MGLQREINLAWRVISVTNYRALLNDRNSHTVHLQQSVKRMCRELWTANKARPLFHESTEAPQETETRITVPESHIYSPCFGGRRGRKYSNRDIVLEQQPRQCRSAVWRNAVIIRNMWTLKSFLTDWKRLWDYQVQFSADLTQPPRQDLCCLCDHELKRTEATKGCRVGLIFQLLACFQSSLIQQWTSITNPSSICSFLVNYRWRV